MQDGAGDVLVNGLKGRSYFLTDLQMENALAPLKITETKNLFDVHVEVTGGGKSAQSDAVRHGISRALILFNPELRTTLKREGFLRRDSRIKERKKPGLKRARRAPQFSKR
jgi:small subunit ribosomal protein S9